MYSPIVPVPSYALAHTARCHLLREGARKDHNLIRLVGHANLLDSILTDLNNAKEKLEVQLFYPKVPLSDTEKGRLLRELALIEQAIEDAEDDDILREDDEEEEDDDEEEDEEEEDEEEDSDLEDDWKTQLAGMQAQLRVLAGPQKVTVEDMKAAAASTVSTILSSAPQEATVDSTTTIATTTDISIPCPAAEEQVTVEELELAEDEADDEGDLIDYDFEEGDLALRRVSTSSISSLSQASDVSAPSLCFESESADEETDDETVEGEQEKEPQWTVDGAVMYMAREMDLKTSRPPIVRQRSAVVA